MDEPLDVLENALAAFTANIERYKADHDWSRFEHAFERWKARTVEELAQVVPADKLDPFRRLPTRLPLGGHGFFEDEKGKPASDHQAWLFALGEDMSAYPDSYGRAVVASRQRAVRRAEPKSVEVAPASMPDKVTLKWMFAHVPVTMWVAFGGALLAAFGLGARLALAPALATILKGIFGIS